MDRDVLLWVMAGVAESDELLTGEGNGTGPPFLDHHCAPGWD